MQRNGVAARLLAWSEAKIKEAEQDPEMLRDLLASFDLPRFSDAYEKSASRVRQSLRSPHV